MERTVQVVAKLAGVSVRTLRYYDEIGLLKHSGLTPAGYRLYDDAALENLQQILFYRELGFPLRDIRQILSDPLFDRREAIRNHQRLLILERERLDGLIALTGQLLKGEKTMSFQEFQLDEIKALRDEYAAEVRERWGGTAAYTQGEERSKSRTPEEWQEAAKEADVIFRELATHQNETPDSPAVHNLVARWQAHISRWYYDCTGEILAELGEMYQADERFQKNIDRYGDGLAEFLGQAIRSYCSKC